MGSDFDGEYSEAISKSSSLSFILAFHALTFVEDKGFLLAFLFLFFRASDYNLLVLYLIRVLSPVITYSI
jgi:hypothetical protein